MKQLPPLPEKSAMVESMMESQLERLLWMHEVPSRPPPVPPTTAEESLEDTYEGNGRRMSMSVPIGPDIRATDKAVVGGTSISSWDSTGWSDARSPKDHYTPSESTPRSFRLVPSQGTRYTVLTKPGDDADEAPVPSHQLIATFLQKLEKQKPFYPERLGAVLFLCPPHPTYCEPRYHDQPLLNAILERLYQRRRLLMPSMEFDGLISQKRKVINVAKRAVYRSYSNQPPLSKCMKLHRLVINSLKGPPDKRSFRIALQFFIKWSMDLFLARDSLERAREEVWSTVKDLLCCTEDEVSANAFIILLNLTIHTNSDTLKENQRVSVNAELAAVLNRSLSDLALNGHTRGDEIWYSALRCAMYQMAVVGSTPNLLPSPALMQFCLRFARKSIPMENLLIGRWLCGQILVAQTSEGNDPGELDNDALELVGGIPLILALYKRSRSMAVKYKLFRILFLAASHAAFERCSDHEVGVPLRVQSDMVWKLFEIHSAHAALRMSCIRCPKDFVLNIAQRIFYDPIVLSGRNPALSSYLAMTKVANDLLSKRYILATLSEMEISVRAYTTRSSSSPAFDPDGLVQDSIFECLRQLELKRVDLALASVQSCADELTGLCAIATTWTSDVRAALINAMAFLIEFLFQYVTAIRATPAGPTTQILHVDPH
mmetsp:Transcript_8284/g.16818  ORF Transcript_8284/g.16818 Transcript_8284/m.16818 type:complete len:659 (-) Transcript_8284:475-2451(-)